MAAAAREFSLHWSGGSGKLRVHGGVDSLSADLADHIAAVAEEAVRTRGVFSLAISGGSIVNCLGLLAEPRFASRCDWSTWHVFWVDERCVPLSHVDSNHRAAHEQWLSKVPIPPSHVHPLNESHLASAEAAAVAYNEELKRCVETGVLRAAAGGAAATAAPAAAAPTTPPAFDLIILGVGPDGHVASLFPNHPLLRATDQPPMWCAPITDSPKPPPSRITLTLPVLTSACHVAVVAMGGSKSEVVGELFRASAGGGGVADGPADAGRHSLEFSDSGLPASLVRPAQGRLLWLLDEAAAKGLVV
eukprot:TRINITY_DN11583_c0_g1_i1.p2 TRINITY_DN11583_c0_g1~~TRINITY_DN11583_c0_g1_i1.p2  ORF type:complete len:304 (+),score=-2.49 TRINITY_DN11583_c0_g1_i1:121-1032(+)